MLPGSELVRSLFTRCQRRGTRMITRIPMITFATLFVLCQQVHSQEEDLARAKVTELEGTWEVVSHVAFDEQDDDQDGYLWRFEGDELYYRRNCDENWKLSGTFSLDPSTMPAQFDYGSLAMPGIYEVDGDSLTICLGMTLEFEPGIRPDRFESSRDNRTILWVLRRVIKDNNE